METESTAAPSSVGKKSSTTSTSTLSTSDSSSAGGGIRAAAGFLNKVSDLTNGFFKSKKMFQILTTGLCVGRGRGGQEKGEQKLNATTEFSTIKDDWPLAIKQ